MVTKTNEGKVKKTSRGMRKHVRRMKQESRKTGVPINELKKGALPKSPQSQKKHTKVENIFRLNMCPENRTGSA